jgi:transketolase
MLLEYCIQHENESSMMRLLIGPSPGKIVLPPDYKLRPGFGVTLAAGNDVVIFAYGPVMLHEALRAAEILQEKKISVKIVNMPWLNRIDAGWLQETINGSRVIYVLEDHSPVGGLGDHLLNAMSSIRRNGDTKFRKLGVVGVPACGSPAEVLSHHRLDALSIAQRVREDLHFSSSD